MNEILTKAIIELGRTRSIYPNIEIKSFYQELKNKSTSEIKEHSLWSCALVNWILNKVALDPINDPTPQEWLTLGENVDSNPESGDIVISEIIENGTPQILVSVLVWHIPQKEGLKCLSGNDNNRVDIMHISTNAILGVRRPACKPKGKTVSLVDKYKLQLN